MVALVLLFGLALLQAKKKKKQQHFLVRSDAVVSLKQKERKKKPMTVEAREEGDVVDASGDGGVMVKMLKRGSGSERPSMGDSVLATYVGRLAKSGVEFDRTHGGYSFEFVLGAHKVLRGFELGFGCLRIGDEAEIRIESDYGYGDTGSGEDVPPGATLIFQVHFVGMKEAKKGPEDQERLALLRADRDRERRKKETEANAAAESSKGKKDARTALAEKLANKTNRKKKNKK